MTTQKRKIKILVFSPFYPPRIGGLESHADEFNKYISQKNIDIVTFTPQLPTNSKSHEFLHNNKVEIIRFPAFYIIPNYPLPKFWQLRFWKLFFNLFKKDFDIVISRVRFFVTSFIALVYAKCSCTPLIHIEHTSDFVQLTSSFKNVIARTYDYTLGKLVLIFSTRIIANSQKTAEFCKVLYKKSNCKVIYRGVEVEKILNYSPNISLKKQYPTQTIITFAGRLIDNKGVVNLLNAVKNLQDNFIVFIIGDGAKKNHLQKLVKKHGIQDKVVFHGFKTQEEVIGIMKISDIIVSPSYTEGLPTMLIEATLCKKAIIATDVGGTSEIISGTDDGILIKPKNISQLTQGIKKLINDKNLRKTYGLQSFTKNITRFNWTDSTEKYTKLFNDILKNKTK